MTNTPVIADQDWTSYDMLPVGVIVIRSDYVVLSWNDCIATWTGITPQEIVGTSLLQTFKNLDKRLYLARIEQVFSGGPAVIFSSQFHPHIIPAPLPNGELRIENTTVVPLRSGTGFHAMIVIENVTDMTRQVYAFREMKNLAENELDERKKAQAAIIEALEFNRAIVDNSPVGILIYASSGQCLSANPAAAAIIGTTPEVLKNQNFYSLESWKKSGLIETATRTLAEKKTIPGQVHLYTSFGRDMWFSLVCTPIHAEDDTHLLVMFEDITERKKAEESLILAYKKLNLLSSITRHDILNQLMSLRSYLELVRDMVKDKEALEFLAKGDYAAENIGHQIEFTRSYQDIGVKSPVWQNVPALVRSATTSLIKKKVRIENTLPYLEIFADPLLERVFFNLAENATRHGKNLTVFRISGEESDKGYRIICEDDGGGIEDVNKEKVFRREYFSHTGFGLYLSREILGITGITITETGVFGKGSRFEILVPPNSYRTMPER
jgi:PAS domain S-box-containing protein